MAQFYGNLKGSRGEATRCGTANSGLSVSARSWAGSVTVEFSQRGARVFCHIFAADRSATGGKLLYSGPLSSVVNASHIVLVADEAG